MPKPPRRPQDSSAVHAVPEAVRMAELLCRRRALRFTAARRQVFKIVCRSAHPLTAYEILRKLGGGTRAPTVYRALDFLETHRLLHKVKSRGAYAACPHPHKDHHCYFLLCAMCGRASECCSRRIDNVISHIAASGGFSLRAATVEIEGVCSECR